MPPEGPWKARRSNSPAHVGRTRRATSSTGVMMSPASRSQDRQTVCLPHDRVPASRAWTSRSRGRAPPAGDRGSWREGPGRSLHRPPPYRVAGGGRPRAGRGPRPGRHRMLRHLRRHRAAGLSRGRRPWAGARRDPGHPGGVLRPGAGLREGQLVFAFHPHQDRFVVGADQVMAVDGVDPAVATMYPLVETALQVCLDAAPRLGEAVLVTGLGAVGILVAALLARGGAEVLGCDPLPARRAAAGSFGVASLPLGADFHRRRLAIRSTQVSTLAAAQTARWDRRRRAELAWRLARELPLRVLATHEFPFERAADAYARLDARPGDLVHAVLRYRVTPSVPPGTTEIR